MTQYDLDTAVAVATGESADEIRRHGFGLADPVAVHFDPESSDTPPAWLDWDQNDEAEPVRCVHSRRKPVAG